VSWFPKSSRLLFTLNSILFESQNWGLNWS
jgi:hypothetical protein